MTVLDGWRSRWRAVWQAVAATGGDSIFDDLLGRYAETRHAYHNPEHIQKCLDHLDAARHLMARPAEVELAIWFHDAIYDPQRNDNEERSALLAEETLRAGNEPEMAQRVGDLIRLTTHASIQLTGDEALLCDIDLAILGAPPERFARYNDAIRREYDWVPDDVYQRERTRVLAHFLERPRIYYSEFFFDRLETQARANITAALQKYHSQTNGNDL